MKSNGIVVKRQCASHDSRTVFMQLCVLTSRQFFRDMLLLLCSRMFFCLSVSFDRVAGAWPHKRHSFIQRLLGLFSNVVVSCVGLVGFQLSHFLGLRLSRLLHWL